MAEPAPPGLLVDTDLLADYLTAREGEVPLLRRLLEVAVIYTTVLQAGELFGAAGDDDEVEAIEQGLVGLKILGASGRYAKTIGRLISSHAAAADGGGPPMREIMIAALARESSLPVVTTAPRRYARLLPSGMLIEAPALAAAPDRGALERVLRDSSR